MTPESNTNGVPARWLKLANSALELLEDIGFFRQARRSPLHLGCVCE